MQQKGMSWQTLLGWFAAAMLTGALLLALIPPYKSPDEGDHLRRAYVLASGNWLLQTQPCQIEGRHCRNGTSMSGGWVDRGLSEYLEHTHPRLRRKESMLDQQRAADVAWAGQDVFNIAPGTGYYFPVIYAPQATALWVAKYAGLSVEKSYHAARFAALTSGVLVLLLAFWVCRPPLSVLALLLLPMSLFQAVSASIDFTASALTVLALACFVRIARQAGQEKIGWFFVLSVLVFVVGTTRAHMTPMVLLLFAVALLSRRIVPWVLAIASTLAILAWMAVAIPATVDFRILRTMSTGEIALFYLQNPLQLLHVFAETWGNAALVDGYLVSFLGLLFDQQLPSFAYPLLLMLLLLVLVPGLAGWQQLRRDVLARSSLVITGLCASLLAFLAMLLTWTPHPATVIEGVQGRYLLLPVMLLFLALSRWPAASVAEVSANPTGVGVCAGSIQAGGRGLGFSRALQRVQKAALYVLGGVSLLLTVQQVISSWYLPVASASWGVAAPQAAGRLHPGPKLSPTQSVPLLLPRNSHDQDMASIKGIGLYVGTWGQALRGRTALMLMGEEGLQHRIEVDLARVRDNHYVYVSTPPIPWKGAELHSVDSSGGLSVWEFRTGDQGQGEVAHSCVMLIALDGRFSVPPGCPMPE